MNKLLNIITLTILTFVVSISLRAIPVATGIQITPNAITAGGIVTLTPNFSNGSGAITPNIGTVVSGNSYTDTPTTNTSYILTVTSNNASVTTSNSVVVYPAPTATLNASTNIFSIGTSIALTPSFSGGTGAITPNVGTVTSGSNYYVTPAGPTTYTLTVTNPIGTTVTANQSVAQTAQPATITLSNLNQTYTGNGIAPTVTTTPNGLSNSLIYYPGTTTPNQVGTYLVTATINNPLYYGIASGMLTINPATQTLNVTAPTNITVGVPVTLNAISTTNGPVTYSLVSGNATLNGAVVTLNNTSPVTIQASQYGNANYLYTSQNITLNGIGYPAATLTTNTGNITLGGSVSLVPTFANGTAIIDNNIGAVTSNNSIVVSPTTNTTYNLTVTNNGGVTANAAVTVNVFTPPTTNGEIINTTSILPGSSITVTPNFAGGTATLTGVGAVVSGQTYKITPNASGVVNLTVTNPAGTVTTQSFGVNVLTPPIIPPTPSSSLANISSRSTITPSNTLTTGFIIAGNATSTVLIRAVGPSLSAYLSNVLATPKLTVYNRNGAIIATNSGWANNALISSTSAIVGAFPLTANSLDCALITTLQPGPYTATVTGTDGSSGNALLEIYEVSSP